MSYRHHAMAGPRWNRLRIAIFRRDGFRCRACGRTSHKLECDHIVPLANGGGEWDVDNLQTLCAPCHANKTRLERRGRRQLLPWERGWAALVAGTNQHD